MVQPAGTPPRHQETIRQQFFLILHGTPSQVCCSLPTARFFLLLISASATREPWGASDGFPLRYSYPKLPCPRPNAFNGCGYSYNPVMVGLDFLFWLAIAAVAVSAMDQAWNLVLSRSRRFL